MAKVYTHFGNAVVVPQDQSESCKYHRCLKLWSLHVWKLAHQTAMALAQFRLKTDASTQLATFIPCPRYYFLKAKKPLLITSPCESIIFVVQDSNLSKSGKQSLINSESSVICSIIG